jgi:hypothetical protein
LPTGILTLMYIVRTTGGYKGNTFSTQELRKYCIYYCSMGIRIEEDSCENFDKRNVDEVEYI